MAEIKKENLTALGLHLTAGAGDGVLTYSDNVADTEFEHIIVEEGTKKGGLQSDINAELVQAIKNESDWEEEAEE